MLQTILEQSRCRIVLSNYLEARHGPPSMRQSRDSCGRSRRSGLVEIRAYFRRHATAQERVARLPLIDAVHFHEITNLFGFEHRDRNTVAIEQTIRYRRR